MPLEIITMQDLVQFKASLVQEIKAMLPNQPIHAGKMLKSPEVCKLLRISSGTLQNLRKNKTINGSKIGGTYYYQYDDIMRMLPQKIR